MSEDWKTYRINPVSRQLKTPQKKQNIESIKSIKYKKYKKMLALTGKLGNNYN